MLASDKYRDIGKLINKLRALGFTLSDLLYSRFCDGDAVVYSTIYDHILFSYDTEVKEVIQNFLSSKGIHRGHAQINLKTVYRILRDVFDYKPVITVEHFNSTKFARHKVNMCLDVIKLIQELQKDIDKMKTQKMKHIRKNNSILCSSHLTACSEILTL
ncbi:centrosomal protein of 44 kDa-like isoform X2 [Schistocerca gregaria]|uniref:centrosomal protein of 44 kDa-like isoform X2 n=1 Tax=Schistocerca gregaria TaxID=7010 RepID=UPI00211E3508|nr:centrosomal protein of 44 kDa-like isoform X2 [Schistocerca gregaria]